MITRARNIILKKVKTMRDLLEKVRRVLILMLACCVPVDMWASVQFSNNNAAFVLTSANASIKLNPTSVSGWNGRSVIKRVTGAGLGDYNIKSYDTNADGILAYSEVPAELLYSNSNAIGLLSRGVRANSAALLYGDRTTSTALLSGDRVNSNAIIGLGLQVRTNSNAIIFSGTNADAQLRTSSNAIVWLDTQLGTLDHGPFDVAVDVSSFELSSDIYLSRFHAMNITTDTEIDGHGNAILFARNPGAAILIIDPGLTVRFKNVLMWEFPEGLPALSLGDDARFIFGPNTSVEIGENSLITTTWFFDGVSILNGRGKTLYLGTGGSIVLRPGSSLLLDNISLKGMMTGKIFCMDNSCTLSLGNVTWMQNADYTFTQGRFDVTGAWELKGTSTFG